MISSNIDRHNIKIVVDESLTWKPHINKIPNKTEKALDLMNRLKFFMSS